MLFLQNLLQFSSDFPIRISIANPKISCYDNKEQNHFSINEMEEYYEQFTDSKWQNH